MRVGGPLSECNFAQQTSLRAGLWLQILRGDCLLPAAEPRAQVLRAVSRMAEPSWPLEGELCCWGPSFIQKEGPRPLDPLQAHRGFILCTGTQSGSDTGVQVFFPADALEAEPRVPAAAVSGSWAPTVPWLWLLSVPDSSLTQRGPGVISASAFGCFPWEGEPARVVDCVVRARSP